MTTNRNIKRLLEDAVDLPALPEITQQVLMLSGDPDASLLSLSILIEKDAALSARILKLVNSPFAGLGREIANIKEAVPLLGASEIRNLTLMISLFNLFPAELAPLYEQVFKQSLCSAAAADFIAEQAGLRNRDDIFLAGLLLYVGKFIFIHYAADAYLEVLTEAEVRGINIEIVEKQILGMTNLEAGELLCGKWNLPDTIKSCIRYRDNAERNFSEEIPQQRRLIMDVSYLGGLTSKIFFDWNKALHIAHFKSACKKFAFTSELDAYELLTSIPQRLKTAGDGFFVSIDQNLSYDNILEQADAELDFLNKKHSTTYLELQNFLSKQSQ